MAELIQIVDSALADAVARSGSWLACRPGCSQCCHGVFEISPVDAQRLRDGLVELQHDDTAKASRVRTRLVASREHLAPWYPGDLQTGVLSDDEEAVELFEEFANADACPILDPTTGTCDLYASRPILCRTFGPPIAIENDNPDAGLAVCELCFAGATEQEIAACATDPSFRELENEVEAAYAINHPATGPTMIAFAFPSDI